jgi:glutamate carboxypeptidase
VSGGASLRAERRAFDSEPFEPVGAQIARDIRRRLEPRVVEMAALLAELVRIESPTDDAAGLERMAGRLEALFGKLGGVVRHPTGPGGASHLTVSVPSARPELPPAAVLGHYDTVWPRGTLGRLPCHNGAGVLTGPGCFDMKGGIILLYFALRELRALGRSPRRPLKILINCDEEVRSRTSRGLIGALAGDAAVAYVLESPLPGGGLKAARKGVAIYRLEIEGRAAHAGIEPGRGTSAILELAHQVQALHALNDHASGTTVNVGVVSGGTRANVVAARASAEIDVRVATRAEAGRVEQAIQTLRPVLPGSRLSVVADLSRPPMEPTPASRRLFARARAIAAGMGVELAEGSTGGASDANLVAATGVPTLDGLGPEGGGAHADDEHVLISSMPRRAALIGGLLAEV